MVVKVSAIKNWLYKSYAKSYLTKGLEALKDTCIKLVFKGDSLPIQENTLSAAPISTAENNEDNIFAKMFGVDTYQASYQNDNKSEAYIFKRNQDLDIEISFFAKLLTDENVIRSGLTTKIFWEKNMKILPRLFELQIILLNISASSAFIERFFSVSGIVCDLKRGNQEEDLIIMRSMLKANMTILTTMNEVSQA